MLAKDEELHKVKEKHLYAEQQLQEMEEKQQQVNFHKPQSQLGYFSVPHQEIGTLSFMSNSLMGEGGCLFLMSWKHFFFPILLRY